MKKYDTNDEKLDAFLKLTGIELFEYQKMYLRELVNGKRPIILLMPKQVRYLQAMIFSSEVATILKGENMLHKNVTKQ